MGSACFIISNGPCQCINNLSTIVGSNTRTLSPVWNSLARVHLSYSYFCLFWASTRFSWANCLALLSLSSISCLCRCILTSCWPVLSHSSLTSCSKPLGLWLNINSNRDNFGDAWGVSHNAKSRVIKIRSHLRGSSCIQRRNKRLMVPFKHSTRPLVCG